MLNSENGRCSYEYSSLLSEGKLNENDIEVLVTGGSVHFLIHLNVDFSQFKLPKGIYKFILMFNLLCVLKIIWTECVCVCAGSMLVQYIFCTMYRATLCSATMCNIYDCDPIF